MPPPSPLPAAVTDDEGNCALPGVMPGSYRLIAWHPTLGQQERPVTIESGRSLEVDVTFARVRR